MPKPVPLVSQDPNPRDVQFRHFGVMNTGGQSKGSLFTSITVNVLLALIIVIIGAAARKSVVDNRVRDAKYITPITDKPPEPKPPPKPPPPKLIPPKPVPPKIEPPKLKLPDVKLPEPPKPVAVNMPKPVPVIVPAPPKLQVAASAPKVVAVNMPAASASIKNNDAHPSAVALGRQEIAKSDLPSQVTKVNMGGGLAGMPPSNTGGGPRASAVSLGNGSPQGSIGGKSTTAVQGVKLGGIVGGTGRGPGNGTGTQASQVSLGRPPAPPPAPTATVTRSPLAHAPVVTYKPKPAYTEEAKALHLEGSVSVRIRVSSTGSVSVVGVTNGLGHGLDQSAISAIQATRFKPALDANGNPIDWEGVVNVTFQMA